MVAMSHTNSQAAKLRRRRNSAAAMQVNDNRELISATRRSEVYRTDVDFAGHESLHRAPRQGTPERVDLEARVCLLYAKGATQTQIASTLDIWQSLVSIIVRKHHIRKGSSK